MNFQKLNIFALFYSFSIYFIHHLNNGFYKLKNKHKLLQILVVCPSIMKKLGHHKTHKKEHKTQNVFPLPIYSLYIHICFPKEDVAVYQYQQKAEPQKAEGRV